MEYGMIYILEGEWTFDSAKTGYNFVANNLIEALNFMAREGWEYISTIKSHHSMMSDKHILYKRN